MRIDMRHILLWMDAGVCFSLSNLIAEYSKADRDAGIGCDLSIVRLKAW